MVEVQFGYLDKAGVWREVTTLEEQEYPAYYHQRASDVGDDAENLDSNPGSGLVDTDRSPLGPKPEALFEGHRDFQENQRGVSFDLLFGPYLRNATEITITDPYIRRFHQARNLMELIEEIATGKDPADEVLLRLITSEENESDELARRQIENLAKVRAGAQVAGIQLDVTFDRSIHDRSIVTDTGWKILLGRGLDIFQHVPNDTFDLSYRRQEFRQVKAFGITYVRASEGPDA
jgi:ATP-dependent Lon protease